MFDLWILNSSTEKKEKKIKLYTVYCMVSFNTLETLDNRVRHVSVLRGNTLTCSRGSRGVKQKGSRRWKGREKVINEETIDVAGGGQNQRVLGTDSELWYDEDMMHKGGHFFSALVNWLRNILINISTTEAAPWKKTNHFGGNIIMGWLISFRKGIVDASWQLTCWYLLGLRCRKTR